MVKEIIVIGAGLAGLTCSVKSASKNIHVKLFSPAYSERSQSVMAMGGINAALNTKGEDDSVNEHYTDTINAGQHINNHNAVEKLTNDAPEIIDWLSKLGTSFTRDDAGNVDVRYFGGQKKMRTAYAGARTGKQILTAINTECRKWEHKDKIKRYVGWRFLSLILDSAKVCRGVVMINENTEEIRDFYADSVVIASGGMNKVFGKISGSLHNDGFVSGKLLHQGVELANMEMIQYHPTTIETPVKRMLITEAARGEGGRLYTLRNGEKWYFMEEWYPEQGALMPRDVVSRSIYRVCHEYGLGIDGENKVYLDLIHLDEKTVKIKLDEVYDVCMNYLNLDPTCEPIPIYPGVHYFMGGIRTDDAHKTNIENLFAIGECSSQYHGANRLGGNSLLGAIHGGWVVADQLEEISCENSSEEYKINCEYEAYKNWKKLQKEANSISSYDIEEEIADIMNETMGIYRTESELKEGLDRLDSLETVHVNSHGSYYDYILLKSLTDIAKAMLSSALARKESRGAHQRLDYPETSDEYRKTTVISLDNDELKITFKDTEGENGMVEMESITVIIKTSKGMKEYAYEGDLNIPVTTLLERINVKHNIKIHYSSSCLQGLCGSCSMIINGLPKLACKTFVNEEKMTKKTHNITIEPLSKFPIVNDLVVDRTSMFENIKNSRQWLEEEARINQDNLEFEYEASQCLMCGCCLEACPNYTGEDTYYGAILPVTSSKISKQERDMDKLKFLKEDYSNHFYNDCVKSLACENVCPMNIQTQRAISIMNRHSIWKFHKLLKITD